MARHEHLNVPPGSPFPDVPGLPPRGLAALAPTERNGHAAPMRAAPAAGEPEPWDYLCMADVRRRSIHWLWRDKLAYGKLSVLAGDGDKGKSWAMLDLAARLSTATPLPGETERPAHASTILLMGEDDPADTIGPRLDAQRADSRRIFLLRGVRARGVSRTVKLQRDMHLVQQLLERLDAKLLVIDGMASYMGGTDGINEIDVRSVLMPLTEMAHQTGVAVVCIMHRNKGQHANPLHAIAGSVAYGNVARCVLGVCDDKDAPGRRCLVPIKGNIIQETKGIGYRIQDFCLHWDAEPVSVTKETIFAEPAPNGHGQAPADEADDESRLGQARIYLRTVLAHHGGRRPMRDIMSDADGIKEKTLRRAKKELAIEEELVYEDDGKHRWYWLWPAAPQEV